MFEIASTAVSLKAALAEITAVGYRSKMWTSRGGKLHPAQPFTQASLRRLLANVLYTGAVTHKGEHHPGEHVGIVSPELWRSVQEKLQLQPVRRNGTIQPKTDALLVTLLRCRRCGHPMMPACMHRNGRVYRYYVCRQKEGRPCAGGRVSASDIEVSLLRHLEPILGQNLSRAVLQRAVRCVTYAAVTRRVAIALADGTETEYVLAEPIRRGVRRRERERSGRVPRISRLMALAIRMGALVGGGKVNSYGDLAEAGQISRPRMSQLLRLRELAPAIQERLLFLPKIVSGRDLIHEHALRKITGIIDWEAQMDAFDKLIACSHSARARTRRSRSTDQS